MTPMIDVTFLLLTFFMLASHFASAERVQVDLPHPDNNQAKDQRFKEKVIINIVRHEGEQSPKITLGPVPVESLGELADRLTKLARRNPRMKVLLRGDRDLSFGPVREVMEIISASGLSRLQVVVEMDNG
jgi:biopolymer transport protein ExbD